MHSLAVSIQTQPRQNRLNFPVIFLALSLFATHLLAIEFQPSLLALVEKHFGEQAKSRLLSWKELTASLSGTDLEKLERVNDFFNKATFTTDQNLWAKEDYWATPVEFLARNAGDCEDYAIAKFFTLLSAGVDEDKLQISYVKALELNQAHMVLAYYATPTSEPLILDNIKADILPASQRPDLEPVYGFNGLGLWLNKFKKNEARALGDADAIDNWSDMLRRQSIMLMSEPQASQ